MTLPREVVPGRDDVVTRRCSERRFFLRPDDITDNAFIYSLALAVQRSKVEVNFACAMAKHHHAGVHDSQEMPALGRDTVRSSLTLPVSAGFGVTTMLPNVRPSAARIQGTSK